MKHVFPYLVLVSAFVLAGSAAYYSIFGLSKLFSSQSLSIIILAGSLEASKLIAATYLHRYWTSISKLIKTYLIAAVVILMAITSLGIYGFLVSAYQDTAYKLENLQIVTTALDSKKTRYVSQLDALTFKTNTINKNIDNLTGALSNNVIRYTDANGNQVIRTSNENRKSYELQLQSSADKLESLSIQESKLNDSISAIDMQILDLKTNSTITSEVGPLKYIAKITGLSMDIIVNWLIILLIIVFDPLAIILLISANKAFELNTIGTPVVVDAQPKVIKDVAPNLNSSVLSYWTKILNDRKIKNEKTN